MSVPQPHAESLAAAWKRAVERVTHTTVDPKARHRPHAPELFFFVTTPVTPIDPSAEFEAPLEAACLAIALEVMGVLPDVPDRERRLVRDAARRAILAAQQARSADGWPATESDASRSREAVAYRRAFDPAAVHLDSTDATEHDATEDDDDEAADARRLLVALAQEGVRALTNARPGSAPSKASRATPESENHLWHPPPEALVAMMQGGPDPVAAGGVAVHVQRCEACRAALEVASFADAPRAMLRAAAASAPAMLAPVEGRLIARRTAPDAEAFAFDDANETRIAIYVDTSQPVQYQAEGVTMDDMRPGYWAGRCARTILRVDGTLHVGGAAEPWALDIARA
jgi:hypothetical protein